MRNTTTSTAGVRGGAALLALALLTACQSTSEISVSEAVVRLPANPDVAAGYLTIDNSGGAGDTLTGVTSEAAREVQMHDTVHDDDMAQMQRQDEIAVGGGETVRFESGGLHLMLLEPDELQVGDTVPLRLRFREAGEVTVEATVQEQVPGMDGAQNMDHMGEMGGM
ncbi:copper chaperone PCu(A)C [Salinactinospora qingdaonensis]|uniref:Copper(I)-binding protein n=1 Tax=Salinactinospora qingdaonensis TaxID=702744 RepID=A0ABP7FBY6_9ACTN